MPPLSKLSRSRSVQNVSIAHSPLLDFLAPAVAKSRSKACNINTQRRLFTSSSNTVLEDSFYTALSQASCCAAHRQTVEAESIFRYASNTRRDLHKSGIERRREKNNISCLVTADTSKSAACSRQRKQCSASHNPSNRLPTPRQYASHEDAHNITRQRHPQIGYPWSEGRCTSKHFEGTAPDILRIQVNSYGRTASGQNFCITSTNRWRQFKLGLTSIHERGYHTGATQHDSEQRRFARGSHLPPNFFDDLSAVTELVSESSKGMSRHRIVRKDDDLKISRYDPEAIMVQSQKRQEPDMSIKTDIIEQMKLLSSMRELEEKLERVKKELSRSMTSTKTEQAQSLPSQSTDKQLPVVLTKDDYANLVDLYYYSHNSRFSPESTDGSPTPLILDDYSFTLSKDFSPGEDQSESVNEDEFYESPLKRIEEMLKQRQLREIAVMQVFVDLLLDDYSSNRALYEAYQQLPDPGVAYLPKGTVRIFLQRMSTPWTLSEKSMLRYLSLIDDMQRAKLPITSAEWSSAVYLAGRAINTLDGQEIGSAFKIWQTMEHEAGVKSSHVTFNILFDIAVRSGRFALGETVLKEMHSRNLRLNRLGRVSLMYYHGLRKDGDGVRKAYRDFVEAGEIVDTLVLNCVIASLLNAQEPQAAEQVYARMKNMQSEFRRGSRRQPGDPWYKRYPEPEENVIEADLASSHLGRILQKAPHLQKILPDQHRDLQASMPLKPDHITFRAMVAYHATTSGDLDRITVLLQDMTDFFQLPLRTIIFQLLFKGFAIHGPANGPGSTWSTKRLDMCWNACLVAIRESDKARALRSSSLRAMNAEQDEDSEDVSDIPDEPTLPSITRINKLPPHSGLENLLPPLSRPPPPRLSAWSNFVLDLAAFPRERLKRLERFHATMFDDENVVPPHETGINTFEEPFFQSVAYTAPEPNLDAEEGEYELPNPSDSGLLHRTVPQSNADEDGYRKLPEAAHQTAATRAMVCWLLRAYARTTKSRRKVEEVWGQARKVFKPRDMMERESVVKVLRRCLRDCDREGNG